MKRELAPASADDARSLLLIPLVRAERAWGHAMEIKQEVAGPGKVKHALRKRRRMLRRMAKATESALELARLAAGCGDPRTVLEASAYAAWMSGARLVEQETDWEGALRAFEEARRAFEELARAGSAADEAVFLELLDEAGSTMQFCEYQRARQRGSGDAADLRGFRAPQGTRDGGDPGAAAAQLEWRSKACPVSPPRAQRHLSRALEALQALGGPDGIDSHLETYGKAFAALSDARRSVQDEIASLSRTEGGLQGQAALEGLDKALAGFTLDRTIERNLELIAHRAVGHEERIRARAGGVANANQLLESSHELARLFGLVLHNFYDLADLAEEDEALMEECRANVLLVKGWRCYYLAHSFAAADKPEEAYALFKRAVECAAEHAAAREGAVGEVLDLGPGVGAPRLRALATCYAAAAHAGALSALEVERQAGVRGGLAALALQDGPGPAAQGDGAYLQEHLAEFQTFAGTKASNARLYKIRPEMKEIPHPPLFLDTVLDRIDFPDLAGRVGRKLKGPPRAEEARPGSSGGGVLGSVASKLGFGWGR